VSSVVAECYRESSVVAVRVAVCRNCVAILCECGVAGEHLFCFLRCVAGQCSACAVFRNCVEILCECNLSELVLLLDRKAVELLQFGAVRVVAVCCQCVAIMRECGVSLLVLLLDGKAVELSRRQNFVGLDRKDASQNRKPSHLRVSKANIHMYIYS